MSHSCIRAGVPGHVSLMLEPAFLMMRLTAGHGAEGGGVFDKRKGPEWHEAWSALGRTG